VPLMEAARMASDTEELKPKPRETLKNLMQNFARWTQAVEVMKHTELAEMVLDESGYTEMWRQDRSPDAAGRLENLKELVRSMEQFENLQGFLEHVSLVMDAESGENVDAVTLMTLHAAKGLEYDTIFLPGWEEGLFPSQRTMDENGRAGLEEERRLAYVGITRAKKRAKIYFASNRLPSPIAASAKAGSTRSSPSAGRPTTRRAGSARRRARKRDSPSADRPSGDAAAGQP
jgi:DNA helicase-2/ATP-dependent DNA helicase PcrA